MWSRTNQTIAHVVFVFLLALFFIAAESWMLMVVLGYVILYVLIWYIRRNYKTK